MCSHRESVAYLVTIAANGDNGDGFGGTGILPVIPGQARRLPHKLRLGTVAYLPVCVFSVVT